MNDFLFVLERDLVDAAGRAATRPRGRPALRSLPLAAALFVVLAASAAAGTLLVLRGSALPAPSERDVGVQQTPLPGSSRIEPIRAADPGGGPPWALRVARSKTGLVCGTVGQVVGGGFGIVGLDNHFRALPDATVDGCGQQRAAAASLIGARVFDAPRRADVRTVVNGLAGPRLRSVSVEAGGAERPARVGPDGAFMIALRGYPEDLGIDVRLAFADGHVESYPLGTSAFVVRDPLGGRAWTTNAFMIDSSPAQCFDFHPAREASDDPVSPAACGRFASLRHPRGYFFAVRRLQPARRHPSYSLTNGHWTVAPLTAVWGGVGDDVTRIVVRGPGVSRVAKIAPSHSFVVILPATVDPGSLRVAITLRDGSVRLAHGDTNLVPPPAR